MSALTLAQASTIVDKALELGRQKSFKPLTVAVLDVAGVLKAFKREDQGVALLRADIAQAKAWGCLGMGVGARRLSQMAEARPHFMAALIETSGGRMVPVLGGVLIRDAAGQVIGAVGVSGDTSENDEVAAVAGIKAAGLVADSGEA
ncbi:GlcG/HbpS family heme-binding protein [Desertibaculum subflavum]|uniref:GlcG/HbpS family heme-binding protein n=1 Tax=Desertibaculum subflavum TaxID=2268458 RepID=UPI000E67649C